MDCGLRIRSYFQPAILCALILFITGCGKIGDPLPPIPRAPLVVDELAVSQEGTRLVIHFPIVRTTRSQQLQRIDIYRLIESTDDPLGLPEEAFSTRATIIHSIPADQIPVASSVIAYQDTFNPRSGASNQRYRYAVRLVSASGTPADFSNYAYIIPLFDLALPPTDLQLKQREKEIEITWSAPTANESGNTPANVVAYNIYRRAGESSSPLVKLNAEPLRATRFLDRNFQFGTRYEYVVRGLSLLPGNDNLSNAIEGNDSTPLSATVNDTFPPSSPSPVQIASIGGVVSLFWPLNSETDVVGYQIYRADSENTPPEKWIKLNPQLHKTASFRDDKVEVGKQYYYQITAIDSFGNESARSETVSEVVAP